MSKEGFIAETLILLNQKVAIPFKELDPQKHGISRATAYRALKKLKEAGLITGDFGLTQETRERLCEKCDYRKRCNREDQKRHREISERLLRRSLNPESQI